MAKYLAGFPIFVTDAIPPNCVAVFPPPRKGESPEDQAKRSVLIVNIAAEEDSQHE